MRERIWSSPWIKFVMLTQWWLTVYEVDMYLTVRIGGPFYLMPTLLAPFIIYLTVTTPKRKVFYWPVVLFTLLHVGASVFAENAGMSRPPAKYMVYMVFLIASSVAFIDMPKKFLTVFKMYLLGFLWFALWGVAKGLVPWHHLLANEDSFGPLMVIGMPIAYFYALGTTNKRWGFFSYCLFGLCVIGLMTSFARGASLTGAVVLLYSFIYSPNKLRNLSYLVVATIIVVPIADHFLHFSDYFKEVKSSAEGDEGRMIIWAMAIRVWQTSPVVGVGAMNYGVAAQRIATPEEAEAMWRGFYNLAVHNNGIQILAEEGLLGLLLWFLMIYHFYRCNYQLRKRAAQERWNALGGGEFNLRVLTRGLDGSMMAFLLSGMFYNQMYIHWFWSLLALSFTLHRIAVPPKGTQAVAAPAAPRRGQLAFRRS